MDLDYEGFKKNIWQMTGIDLSKYKEAQMKRRLIALREKRSFRTFSDYYQSLSADKNMREEFLDRMTINVSEFYRNPSRWEVLEQKILPRLLEERSSLKVWSAACSTGEEPYTLSMILSETSGISNFSILATDLDEHVLEHAKNGYYLEKAVQDVPLLKKKRYFSKQELGYRVCDDLKKHVAFKKQNLLSDSCGNDFDLIVCRNVMIYFTEEAKTALYEKFSKALRPGGTLFVGSTEQIFNPGLYALETEEPFFYRKKEK
ncbi:CheR family methyltransferase [Fictibacillus phosphorivorans]|uniref:CheR family methyltransferase n=1 Tax=Fictibacillus phosphorivorans TaxID=1221500 RepID=UPI00203D20CE|nr:protein-glutamate O-methyltransferase CheR [Fictibacillus phosphorivorans]MCM3718931.1 protein-glutamate O-methyltransferase CheR [Fictibacillus phosphorivorans]MCM3776553.1 protein-glutamate O-methyltransferase CheR [Fictibacillus phosphorivorans]